MKYRRPNPIALIFLPILLSLVVSCSGLFGGAETEHLFSYREVGNCHGIYVGESHTPTWRIPDCRGLLTTDVKLRVDPASQVVALIEEDLKINIEYEPISLEVNKLNNCKVIDRENFTCDGLIRVAGVFTDSSRVGGRRLSKSYPCSIIARLNGGWVGSDTMDLHDSQRVSVIYWIVFFIVIFVIWGLVASRKLMLQ